MTIRWNEMNTLALFTFGMYFKTKDKIDREKRQTLCPSMKCGVKMSDFFHVISKQNFK